MMKNGAICVSRRRRGMEPICPGQTAVERRGRHCWVVSTRSRGGAGYVGRQALLGAIDKQTGFKNRVNYLRAVANRHKTIGALR